MKPGIQNITFELKRDRGLPSKCELVNRRGGEGGAGVVSIRTVTINFLKFSLYSISYLQQLPDF